MSGEQEKRWLRYQSLMKITEPYEMKYWKHQLNTPYKKFILFVKYLIEGEKSTSVHSHR